MEKKSLRKLQIFLAVSVISASAAVLFANNGFIKNHSVIADTSNYTLTLSKDNGKISTSYSTSITTNSNAKTSLGNYIEIAYYNVGNYTATAYGQMKASGSYFYNTDTIDEINKIYALTNILSISATWTGSGTPTLYYGNVENPSTNSTTMTSGQTIGAISGYNFFTIKNSTDKAVVMTSVTIVYGCASSSSKNLESIAISDSASSYSLGEIYSTSNQLIVTGKYDDNTESIISSGYTINGNGFTPTSAFTTTGIFSVSVTYKGITSNSIDIEVISLAKTVIEKTYTDYNDNNIYRIDNCPTTGTPKLLIIPIWFTDSSTYITSEAKKGYVRSDIASVYLGTAADTGWNSVKSFYETESNNKVTLNGTVSDWYACGSASTAYYSSSSVTSSLVTTATNWYFTNNTSDSRSNYDSDNDGYLDGVILIYGAPDYSALGNNNASNLWAYCYWLQESASKTSPVPNVFFWASYDFMYNSTKASSRAGTSYNNGDCSNGISIDAHTFIHEMGHVFGLEDYYDYSNAYKPAGGFSMQDYNVGGHDPYSVMAYGWADPYIPTESCSITISSFQSSHDMILLTPNWNSYNSPFDEYLLLELYTPTGLNEFDSTYTYSGNYPKGPSETGIRLWHVDARLAYTSGNYFSSSKITTNPNISGNSVYHAMSNTYYSSSASDYISVLGSSYANYNILQLIRNSTSATYKPTDNLSNSVLFRNGSSFNMSSYGSQFVNTGKLNSSLTLGWSFSVSISGSGDSASAIIALVKA